MLIENKLKNQSPFLSTNSRIGTKIGHVNLIDFKQRILELPKKDLNKEFNI